jgi:hypothetical protein
VFEGLTKGWFEVKVRGRLGSGHRDDKEIDVLGRTIMWKEWGIEYEGDEGHRKKLMESFGLDGGSTGLVSNGDKEDKEEEGDGEDMGDGEATEFRGGIARINYLGQDSPDMQFPELGLSRKMSQPKVGGWRRMKKVVRYLVGRVRVVWAFGWQDEGHTTRTLPTKYLTTFFILLHPPTFGCDIFLLSPNSGNCMSGLSCPK